jgi:hypothetical protein
VRTREIHLRYHCEKLKGGTKNPGAINDEYVVASHVNDLDEDVFT